MQIWGPAVAGGLLDECVSSLRDVVVVDESGLITCQRCAVGHCAQLLISWSAHGTSHRANPHGRWRTGEWKRRWERRVEGRRVSRQQQHPDDTWMTCARHLEPMSRATVLWVWRNKRKCDVWGCSVHTSRRLQEIAISCKLSVYNNFWKNVKIPLWVSW